MVATGTIVALAGTASQAGKWASEGSKSSCIIMVTNDTSWPMVPSTYITPHGSFGDLKELPAIPPKFCDGKKAPTTYKVTEAVAVTLGPNAYGASAVLQWELLHPDDSLYLTIKVNLAQARSQGDNFGGAYLTKEKLNLETYWKSENYQDPQVNQETGIAKNSYCDERQGKILEFQGMGYHNARIGSISMDNLAHCSFDITISEIQQSG